MANIILKTPEELAIMRKSGRLLASVFDYLDKNITVGTSTMEINDLAERYIIDQLGARECGHHFRTRRLYRRFEQNVSNRRGFTTSKTFGG